MVCNQRELGLEARDRTGGAGLRHCYLLETHTVANSTSNPLIIRHVKYYFNDN